MARRSAIGAAVLALASRYRLRTISDLARAAPGLVFGGPPECPERPDCLPGLRRTYGLRFRAFAALDAGGPLTRQALEAGDIGAALLFTTDPAIRARHLYTFDGGCVTYRFSFVPGAASLLALPVDTAVAFEPRAGLSAMSGGPRAWRSADGGRVLGPGQFCPLPVMASALSVGCRVLAWVLGSQLGGRAVS